MASNRDLQGRYVQGFRSSPETEFKPGQHWRKHQAHWNKDWLFKEYVTKSRSAKDIADEVGCTENNILYWLRKHDIPRRTMSEVRNIKHWGANGESNPMFGKIGELSHSWRGGISPDRQQTYSRSFWKKIVEAIHERDGHQCVRCGTTANIGTHHLKSWKSCPEARFDLNQIVTICKTCHNWIHSKRNINYEYLSSRRYTG